LVAVVHVAAMHCCCLVWEPIHISWASTLIMLAGGMWRPSVGCEALVFVVVRLCWLRCTPVAGDWEQLLAHLGPGTAWRHSAASWAHGVYVPAYYCQL
jgi:hypothetical protein